MTYRYEVESNTPLVVHLGIANRIVITPAEYEQTGVGEEHELVDKGWGHKVKIRRLT